MASSMEDDIPPLDALTMRPDGDVVYLPICDSISSMPPRPHFSFGNHDNDAMGEYCSEAYRGSAGLYIAANIGLFERALLFRGDTVLRCDKIGVTRANVSKFLPLWRSMSSRMRTREENGTCVLLLGRGYHVWGHWLIDFLPKLYILEKAGYDLTKLRYLVPENTPAFGIEILDLVGITAERRIVYNQEFEFVRPGELLIPTLVRTGNRPCLAFKDAMGFVTSLVRSRQPSSAIRDDMKRIFVSRGLLNTTSRRLLNRDRIERIATGSGFVIVHPETLPPHEQFALFANADRIAGDYGSALHTSIFSDTTTSVCALRGTGTLPGFVQSAIGDALGQPTGYVFGEMATGDPTESFTISEAAFEDYLNLTFNGETRSPAISETEPIGPKAK